MEILSRTSNRSPLRDFIRWIIEREDIAISTVSIEYFKIGKEDKPVVLRFGHREEFDEV